MDGKLIFPGTTPEELMLPLVMLLGAVDRDDWADFACEHADILVALRDKKQVKDLGALYAAFGLLHARLESHLGVELGVREDCETWGTLEVR